MKEKQSKFTQVTLGTGSGLSTVYQKAICRDYENILTASP